MTSSRILAYECPHLLKEWDYKANDNLYKKDGERITPYNITIGSNIKVSWKCTRNPNHTWYTRISHRTNGHGCPYCSGQKVSKENSLAYLRPDLAEEWCYEKNRDLKPEHVTKRSSKSVYWICNNNPLHIWSATIDNRYTGRGCPYCNIKSSFPEQAIFHYIKKIFPETFNRYLSSENVEIDIYINEINLGIEYDGFLYHKDRSKEDKFKNKKLLLDKKINLIRVRELPLKGIYDFNCINFFVNIDDDKSLQNCIKKIFTYIINTYNISSDIKIRTSKLEIDIENDRFLIKKKLDNIIKNNSFGKLFPKISKEWDTSKNAPLTPYNLAYGSNMKVWWKCLKCGNSWEATVSHRTISKTGCPKCNKKNEHF